MTPDRLSRTVLRAVRRAVDDAELDSAVGDEVERGRARIVVEQPRPGGRGDYATNVALQLAGPAGLPPRGVAEILARHLADTPGIAAVDVTGPGFLNLTLDHGAATAPPLLEVIGDIRRRGLAYGHSDALRGERVELRIPREVRAEAVAQAVARIARSQGADVDLAHVDRARDANLRPVPARPQEAVALLGADAGRWALLYPAAHDHPRVADAEDRAAHLAQRPANPLFRVRYAYARTRALTRNAADLGFTSAAGSTIPHDDRHDDLEGHDGLVRLLADHPRILLATARRRAPDRLARHLVRVADVMLHTVHDTVLPLGEEKPSAAHRARLALAEAAGTVLAGGLTLLGIDAPEYV